MYRTWIGIGSAAVAGVIIGFGLGSASGQQTPKGIEPQELGRVDAGENCPGHVLRMRRVTFAPGASIPMHSHKERPEVVLVMEGTLTNSPDVRRGAASALDFGVNRYPPFTRRTINARND